MEEEEVALTAKEAQLTLGVPLAYDASTSVVGAPPEFAPSFLWWRERQILAKLPPFHFKFLLAIDAADLSVDDLHASLLYIYMRSLKLGKKGDYDMSYEATHLKQLRKAVVRGILPHNMATRDVEILLGHVHWFNVQAMYAERSRSWRQANAAETGEESTGPQHHLFEIEYVNPVTWKPSDAFQTVVQVGCLNHTIAANVLAELVPSIDMPKSKGFEYNNPPVGSMSYGRWLFVGNKKCICHLVGPHVKDGIRALFRFNASAQDFAVAHVAGQLGGTRALVQTLVHGKRAQTPAALQHNGILLVAHASPFQNDVFVKASALPKPTLLATTRIYTQTDGVMNFNAEVVKLSDIAYWGTLTQHCSIERRFAIAAPAGPPRARHAGGIDASSAMLKRLRDVRDDLAEEEEEERPPKQARTDT